MGKITDYSAIQVLNSGNVLLVDGTGGTKKISANLLTKAFAEISDDVNVHKNTYGGRSLGTSVTAEQWAQKISDILDKKIVLRIESERLAKYDLTYMAKQLEEVYG